MDKLSLNDNSLSVRSSDTIRAKEETMGATDTIVLFVVDKINMWFILLV